MDEACQRKGRASLARIRLGQADQNSRIYAVRSLGRIEDVSALPTLRQYKEELEQEHEELTRTRVDYGKTALNMGWWAVKAAAVVGASVAISRFVGNRTPPWVANTLRDNPVVRTQMATKMGEAVGLNEEQQFVEHHYSLLSDVEWAISAIKASERVEGSRASDSEDSELDSQAVVSHEAWPKVTIIKQDSAVETEAKSTGSANAAGGG